jgi:ABC-type phosphate/phosphonate transport system ATPase subunit
MIEIQSFTKRYRKHQALQDINLPIETNRVNH